MLHAVATSLDLFHRFFCSAVKTPKKPIQVVYVPSHLFHMLFELFKVSRAALLLFIQL